MDAKAFDPLPNSVPVTMAEATRCMWPVGETHPVLFCNNALDPKCSYSWCTEHHKKGVTLRGNK